MIKICDIIENNYLFVEVNMSIIKKRNEDLFVYVKNTILTYCPYSDDRLSILGNAKSPEIDIEVNIRDNQTQVMFLFGNNNSLHYRI